MKQEILCPKCSGDFRKLFPSNTPYEAEGVRLKKGVALDRYLCDWCCHTIDRGDPCSASSIFTNDRPYFDWESAYISDIEDIPPIVGPGSNDKASRT